MIVLTPDHIISLALVKHETKITHEEVQSALDVGFHDIFFLENKTKQHHTAKTLFACQVCKMSTHSAENNMLHKLRTSVNKRGLAF